jgi:hypothetical protein
VAANVQRDLLLLHAVDVCQDSLLFLEERLVLGLWMV